ncbi:MAG TPA: rhomboid family intramembrane serine protease [Vicinamibacterales bacterium]|nr:rhomboid family intramembrane serine protease [Vicinamibacterales bacterium]
MFKRQTTGSVVCTSCGVLVGVNDETCYNCGRRNPGMWGYAPALRALGADLGFVPFVIGTCSVLYVLTLLTSFGQIGMSGLFGFLSPSIPALFLFGATGPGLVTEYGRWWTILSASWLHGSAIHILFNMLSVRQLAPAVADMYGPGRMVIIYTAGGVAGFALSVFWGLYLPPIPLLGGGGGITIGASACITGLLGAIYYYGHRGGSSIARSYATQSIIFVLMQGIFLGGIINNLAHGGGFVGGYVAARWLDPLKPERVDHIAIALVCLGLSLLSVIASVLHGLPVFLQAIHGSNP